MTTTMDFRMLIEELASKNQTPKLNKRDSSLPPEYPPGFDHRDDNRVAKAYDKLSEHVEQALPFLIDAVDDKRYSFTWESTSGVWHNQTVGTDCWLIILAHVPIYRDHVRRRTRLADDGFPTESKALKGWWTANKQRPLVQLQLDWVEWAIAEERKTPFENDDDKDEKKVMDELQRIRQQLVSDKQPIKIKHRFQQYLNASK